MIQPKIEKVYKDIKEQFLLDFDPTAIEEHEGYFFTPEEFEQFKREFGKELLEKAANNAKLLKFYVLKAEDPEFYYKNEDDEDSYIHRDTNGTILGLDTVEVNKESIISVLDEYLLNNKL